MSGAPSPTTIQTYICAYIHIQTRTVVGSTFADPLAGDDAIIALCCDATERPEFMEVWLLLLNLLGEGGAILL
jgi:hypothetical protein